MTTSVAVASLTEAQKALVCQQYSQDGFFLGPKVLPDDLIARVSSRMDAVVAGEYETGVPPIGRSYAAGAGLSKLQKIDNTHLCDRVIHEAISHSGIGEWAATVTGAEMVQVFATQLLVKPPGTADTSNVGWHQDMEYWCRFVEGELFTAWLAVSDVTAESGPMRFVQGSHSWGLLEAGDFFSGKMDETKARMQAKHGAEGWNEVAGILPAGAVSFHHNLTIHGSGANTSALPRKSFAIHMRTENSRLAPGIDFGDVGWLSDWDDVHANPVIYRKD